MKYIILLEAFILLTWGLCFAQTNPEIDVNPSSQGLTFNGIGALSGGGATSLFLLSYPEQQRNEILDLLFKPGYGAAYQVLKVEIGGDINSTDGTEPSHARTREELENPKPEYFNRGYEWWLMKEAKKRNPDIQLQILQWGAPGWIGDKGDKLRKRSALAEKNIQWFFDEIIKERYDQPQMRERWERFYSQDNIDYIIGYIQGLKKYHDLTIDYCGVWNEVQYDASWIKMLRQTLDMKGLKHVGIIAADQCFDKRWDISNEMLEDSELMDAIACIGAHYPGWGMPTANAWKTGKPISASEECDWGGLDWDGALGYARTFNRNYINGKITRSVVWNAIVSYYDNLPCANRGPMKADKPWSGHYEISPGLWAFAHTTQFTKPGWRYLDSGCGMMTGGSYVTLCDPLQAGRFSIIVESSQSKVEQILPIRLSKEIQVDRLHLWKSSAIGMFEKQEDLVVRDGRCLLRVEPNCLFSVTTTKGQGKGDFSPPPAKQFPFPYRIDFEQATEGQSGLFFADLGGAFEVAKRPDGKGKCLKQVITQPGIDWIWVTPAVLTIIGDKEWTDYTVSCDLQSDGKGKVSIYGRLGQVSLAGNYEAFPISAYCFELHDSGTWNLKAGKNILAEGKVTEGALHVWRHLDLMFQGSHITARIDGAAVADITDTSFKKGMAGVGSGWNQAWFDNLSIAKNENK